MSIRLVHHVNIATPRLEETRRFFVDVLGLEVGPRPESVRSQGYWLFAEGRPLLHLQATDHEVGRSAQSALNHFAFEVTGLDEMVERLAGADVPFHLVDVAGTNISQVFVTDPNGVRLELTTSLPAAPKGPAGATNGSPKGN